jgi:ABC-type uncharacterized transport system substrate-binding protein
MMKRREFITLLGGAAASWPIAARAEQSGIPTVGFLGTGSSSGWFVRSKVNVIVTGGSAVSVLKQSTSVVPIVFILATDPIGGGLIASLSRPGENVTGSSNLGVDLAAKRLELLREAVPKLRRLAILANAGYPDSLLEMNEVQSAAERLGLEVSRLEIWQAKDLAPAFETLKENHDSLYVVVDGLIAANRTRILTFATSARLPTIVNAREHAEAGALMSYGPNFHTCSVEPPSTWIGFCAERIPLSCQSSSRPNSIWSSIS